MRTIHGTTELGPATEKRQVYSPLEAYWIRFQEWRRREKLRAELCRLTDIELADIGITRGEIDHIAMPHRSTAWHNGARILMLLCCTFLLGSESRAQCTARDVLQNQPRFNSRIRSALLCRRL